ncbi:pentapeptide repeat-containing protein [Fibrella aestuarina]|uniref:pentapeptide repeat-containing protein n=1 Tax=Fibrella aestuarina TaxID=651143 RepID=UPI0009FCB072|nr:pentapeptide repeat-containing protein [Fibrella aestuarina]
MEKNTNHKGVTWDLKTRIIENVFSNCDFTQTNFNSAIFDKVIFVDCYFDKTGVSGSKLFHKSSFKNCQFMGVNFYNSTFGSNDGNYEDCLFFKCNFQGKEFNFTNFINCRFDNCKLKNINFNGSSFDGCNFIGKLSDITFNGIYDTNKGRMPVLKNVNFYESVFGEFVTFIDCDFSTITPPKGQSFDSILYKLYESQPNVLSSGSKDRIVIKS